jgi:pimeloyl-ACP methyl ester carboxylesterase
MPIANLAGININYRVYGEGEPLVLIMGFGTPLSMGIDQVRFFKKHFRVVAFDNRGVGRSDKPRGPYSTRIMAEDTAKLMDYLGIGKAHVMGISMGGMIAQELAINHPDKVNKLVLACTYAAQDENSGDTEEVAELWRQKAAPKRFLSAMVSLSFNKPLYRYSIGLLAKIFTLFLGFEDEIGLSGQMEACRNHNTLDRLRLITAPTLVIVGTKDRVIKPTSSEVIASKNTQRQTG